MKKIILLMLILCSSINFGFTSYPAADNPFSATVYVTVNDTIVDELGVQDFVYSGGVYEASSPFANSKSADTQGSTYLNTQFDGLKLRGAFSLAYWFKTNAYVNGDFYVGVRDTVSRGLTSRMLSTAGTGFDYILFDTSGNQHAIAGTSDANSIFSQTGVWQHLCIVHDEGTGNGRIRWYVNGTEVPTNYYSNDTLNDEVIGAPFYIPARNRADTSSVQYISDQNIADVIIINDSTLSESDCMTLYLGNYTVPVEPNITYTTEDTKTRSAGPTTNFGGDVSLEIQGWATSDYYSYMQFNLGTNNTETATLNMYKRSAGSSASPFETDVFWCNNSFDEYVETWNTQAATFQYCTEMFSFLPSDYALNERMVFDIQNITSITNGGDFSIMLRPYFTTNGYWSIYSKEYSGGIYTAYINSTLKATPTPPVDTCTCAGLNEDWEIDLTDECVITDACDLGTGKLTFTGATGFMSCDATIDTTGLGDPGIANGLRILDDCRINID